MAEGSQDTKYCSNCKKDISASNFVMHEMHCRRHIILCGMCKEPVPRSEMDDHMTEVHAKVNCTQCGCEVEKPKLQEHMTSQCLKKPAHCPFCELEMPGDEVHAHQDYCGTRTENCPKCGQFVMMKDQMQHDASNCEYPTPKPATNGHGLRDRDLRDLDSDYPGLGMEFPDDDFASPFAMGELSRMIEGARLPQTLNSRADIPGFGKRRNVPESNPRSYTNNNTTSSRKSTTNRRSELNRQRQQVTEPEPDDVDEEADRLLALRLQQADDHELDSIIRQIEKQSPGQPPSLPDTQSPVDVNTYPDDDDLIPCEFCGEPFPVDILVQHQSGCDPLSTGQWNEEITLRGERNNEVQGGGSRGRGVAIPVINNLDPDWSAGREIPIRREWETPPLTPPEDVLGDEVVLPCEFCYETFPFELLIQHQSVCELNPTMTPQTQTPAVPTHRKTRNRNVLSLAAQEALQQSERAHRHQGMPTWVGGSDDSEDEVVNYPPGVYDLSESRNPESRSHGGRMNNSGSHRSVASKYGAPAAEFDDYLTRRVQTRTRDNTSSQFADSDRSRNNSRRSNDDRTRETLERLLSEGGAANHDLLASVTNSKKKSAKNEDNYEKRGQAAAGARRTPVAVSSRDVMREMNRTSNTTQATRQKKRLNGSADDSNPPFDIQLAGQRAPRQRPSRGGSQVRGRQPQGNSRPKPTSSRRFPDDDNI